MFAPRSLASRKVSANRGVNKPCPRYSAATVSPAMPQVGSGTPPNQESNSRSTIRATKTSESKAPNQAQPG